MSNLSNYIQTFGKATKKNAYGTRDCLVHDNRPPTPEKLKKYRDSNHVPGKGVPLYGKDSTNQFKNRVYGKVGSKKEFVSNLFQLEIKKKHPYDCPKTSDDLVGKQKKYHYNLPTKTNEKNFRYGSTSAKSEDSKNIMYPNTPQMKDDIKNMYKISHKKFEPGEQTRYGYKWDNTRIKNPSEFTFGIKGSSNGTAEDVMKAQTKKEIKVVSKRWRDYNKMTKIKLGKGKRSEIDPNKSFGVVSKKDPWGVRECIMGNYSKDQQRADVDVGRTKNRNYKNVNLEVTFGKVHVDKGDENLGSSLNPSKYSELGLLDDDFHEMMGKDEIKSIVMDTHMVGCGDEFDKVWEHTLEMFKRDIKGKNECSVGMIMKGLFDYKKRNT